MKRKVSAQSRASKTRPSRRTSSREYLLHARIGCMEDRRGFWLLSRGFPQVCRSRRTQTKTTVYLPLEGTSWSVSGVALPPHCLTSSLFARSVPSQLHWPFSKVVVNPLTTLITDPPRGYYRLA